MAGKPGPTGVLLSNLGTPDAPTAAALRRYLGEFLWDKRIVDVSRLLWWPILHGLILRMRPARSAVLYQQIWTPQGSPLLHISLRQKALLQQTLDASEPGGFRVVLGMRYGHPSIASALDELRQAGVQALVVLPLYPQNSCSTTASTFDAVTDVLRASRHVPSLRFIADYHDNPGYIDALAASIVDTGDVQAQKLVFSFHGTPERFRAEGDPYYAQCLRSAELVAAKLGLDEAAWTVSFQSRFGREPWLQPYTDVLLQSLPAQGVRRVQVICPGFAADCLETLEEIAVENQQLFLAAGGESLHYIPALNDRPAHIQALAALILDKPPSLHDA